MIINEVVGVNGKPVIEMIPENEEEEALLLSMGENIDLRDGFNTDPNIEDDQP